MIPSITPMTIPAIAPALRPPPDSADEEVTSTLAPVATGASKGTVVVGTPVAVSTTSVDAVGRRGAIAVIL